MELKLPAGIIGRGDVARLLRELGSFNDRMVGAQLRQEDAADMAQHSTPLLTETAALNAYNLLDGGHREELAAKLIQLQEGAPSLHISFTAEPSPRALVKITTWLRQNIHPQVLVTAGIQPNIAIGCVVRTNNRVFDLSLKQTLKKNQPLMVKLIKGARNA